MQSHWNNEDAAKADNDPLSLRAYATAVFHKSAPQCTLFGTVKMPSSDVFGAPRTLLLIPHGNQYIGLDNDRLEKLGRIDSLSSDEQSLQLSLCGERPLKEAPTSDTLLHAAIPYRFVNQTRSSATLALANHANAIALANQLFGKRVAVAPSAESVIDQAKTMRELLGDSELEGILVPNLGLLTFSDEAKRCYEQSIAFNQAAVDFFASKETAEDSADASSAIDLMEIANLRKILSISKGQASIVIANTSPAAIAFSTSESAASLGAVTEGDHETLLSADNPSPQVIWKDRGILSLGPNNSIARSVASEARYICEARQLASSTGGWQGSSPRSRPVPELKGLLQGKVALVSGSAAGIGLATATTLTEAGACVIGADINPEIESIMEEIGALGITVDLTDESQIEALIARTIREFGGLDIVVSNAGIFTAGAFLEDMEQKNWERSMAVNLTSHQVLMKHAIPFVKKGIDPTIIFIGSRNVNAPGAGAASYSCAKAGLTQLCRVAALELAPEGVRVNIVHPDAVFDTKLWTKEALERSAERYGITVEQYKKRNLMKTEITSRSVGNTVVALASDAFAKTTGAQIPVDGGNDRII